MVTQQFGQTQMEIYDSFYPKYELTIYKKIGEKQNHNRYYNIGNKIMACINENNHKNKPQLKHLGKELIKTHKCPVVLVNKAERSDCKKKEMVCQIRTIASNHKGVQNRYS